MLQNDAHRRIILMRRCASFCHAVMTCCLVNSVSFHNYPRLIPFCNIVTFIFIFILCRFFLSTSLIFDKGLHNLITLIKKTIIKIKVTILQNGINREQL